MADPTPQQVRDFIAAGLSCDHVQVEGDGRHFFATIVSAEFESLPRVRRHQRVYAALGDRMREQIHALSMKTLTPAECAAQARRRLARPPPPLIRGRSALRVAPSRRRCADALGPPTVCWGSHQDTAIMDKLLIRGGRPLKGEVADLRRQERRAAARWAPPC